LTSLLYLNIIQAICSSSLKISVLFLYRFLVFSLYEVKNQFSKHHEKAADNIEVMKKKIDIILEYIRKN